MKYFEKHPEPVQSIKPIIGDALVLVHSDRAFDGNQTAEPQVRSLQKRFRKEGKHIVHIYGDFPALGWYGDEVYPTHAVISSGGRNSLKMIGGKVTMVGGFWGVCFQRALADIVQHHFESSDKALEIELPLAGIYSGTPAQNLSGQNIEKLMTELIGFFSKTGASESYRGDLSKLQFQLYDKGILKRVVGENRPQVVKVNFVDSADSESSPPDAISVPGPVGFR